MYMFYYYNFPSNLQSTNDNYKQIVYFSVVGEHGSVTQGLSSQWIPKGFWSWGGAVSEHPPVWCELYADGGKVSSDLQQLLKSLGHSMNLNSDPEFTL